MSVEISDHLSREYVVQCLSELTSGGTLLKAGRAGKNHFRRFCLASDLTRLTWESNKRADAAVLISQITELKLGQNTANFKRNPLPECESRSFSLLYSDRSLDIVCKDRREFEVWTTGLQALLNGFDDTAAVTEFISQQRSRSMGEDRIKVALGTLRTRVLVQESACDLYTWGSGVRGMLGHKDEDREKIPRVVESLLGRDIVMAVCGVSHTIALSVTGEVYAWGSGIYGQLGHGNMRDRFSPLMIGNPLRGIAITLVACHEYHSAAVADNGELFTWGKAGPHLGYDTKTTKQTSPRRVEFPGSSQVRVIQVACGVSHTLACSETGKVYSFGTNKYGELGLVHPTPPYMTTPTHISSLQDIAKLACGRHHSAAIDGNGKLWMWGWGARGQLGQANVSDSSSPTQVEGPLADHLLNDISCGDAHNCALDANGNVFSWGDNSAGQLGIAHSSYNEVTKPRQINITTGHSIIQVACGANFSAALSSVGRVFTWGYGANGQLANNELKGRQQAMEVEALLDKQVRVIACGAEHMACTVVHGWVPDEEAKSCMACRKTFTVITRRHHCRKCGGIYCGSCTTKRFPLLDRGYSDPVRVCERCYGVLTKES